MQSTFKLGRVAGVEIGINWTWLVVFALTAWTLADGVFPETNPGLSNGAYWSMGIVAAAVFFVSILAHELGHALRARREGMEIDGITLWLFGGVARFRGQFPSAGAEFRIAIAGPVVTLALAVAFILTALAGLPGSVDGVVTWLGFINLFVLAFNLLPALPLDGGRVLRAALWHTRGDFVWATRIAGAAGRGFGFVLIGVGVFMFIVQGQFSGVWLGFLGWFLLAAAEGEVRHSATRQALSGLRVGDLMVRNPVTADAASTVGAFMDQVVWPNRYTTYPIVAGGEAVGILPFRCVAEIPRAEWDARHVRDCMVPLSESVRLRETDDLVTALEQLNGLGTGRALVLDDGDRLVGLLSLSDVARALETPRPPRLERRMESGTTFEA